MDNIFLSLLIITLTTIATVFISLSGGFLLLSGSKLAGLFEKISLPFAIFVLLYATFFDVIPEALESGTLPGWAVATLAIVGFVFCAALRLFSSRFHRHDDSHALSGKPQATAMLVVDSLHTLADGVVLGLAFAASLGTGILTAVATAAHEIPQELGDFAIMKRSKVPRRQIIRLEIISGLLLVPATIAAFFIGDQLENFMPIVLSLIAGNLIYITLGELIAFFKLIKYKESL